MQNNDAGLDSIQKYSAKYYVDNNSYLDVDVVMLSRNLMNYTKREDEDLLDVDLANVKAALPDLT